MLRLKFANAIEPMIMEWLNAFRSHAVELPTLVKFAIVMAIIVGVPALARRVRIPELVGLLARIMQRKQADAA